MQEFDDIYYKEISKRHEKYEIHRLTKRKGIKIENDKQVLGDLLN